MIIDTQLSAVTNFGLLVDFIEQDEQLHRAGTRLKPTSKNGWYIAYSDILIMGDWQTGITETFKLGSYQQTRLDSQRIKQAIERQKREKALLHVQAAIHAQDMYQKASQVVVHPYLSHKGLDSAEGLKLDRNQLLIPLYDLSNGKVENLQRIFPDHTKRFLKNGRITGLCCPCGLLNMQSDWPEQLTKVFICEGYATAASVYQMTHQPVLAAMNAGNLLAVAKLAKAKWPDADIVIAGDDDHLTEQSTGINAGRAKATEAANLLGAQVSFPPFTLEQKSAGLTDWNDYYSMTRSEAA
jgi:putative DNA primase/helicase